MLNETWINMHLSTTAEASTILGPGNCQRRTECELKVFHISATDYKLSFYMNCRRHGDRFAIHELMMIPSDPCVKRRVMQVFQDFSIRCVLFYGYVSVLLRPLSALQLVTNVVVLVFGLDCRNNRNVT